MAHTEPLEGRLLWARIHAVCERAEQHQRDQKAILEQLLRYVDASPSQWWTGGLRHGLDLACDLNNYARRELQDLQSDDPEYIPF